MPGGPAGSIGQGLSSKLVGAGVDSSGGAMVGHKSSDTQGPNPGTRGRPGAHLERVRVCPHGPCDVQGEFVRLAGAYAAGDGRWRLTPYRPKDVRLCSPGQETQPTLLSTNPWAVRPQHFPMPQGHYDGARG